MEVSRTQRKIIELPGSVFLQGRSGTGKTVCLGQFSLCLTVLDKHLAPQQPKHVAQGPLCAVSEGRPGSQTAAAEKTSCRYMQILVWAICIHSLAQARILESGSPCNERFEIFIVGLSAWRSSRICCLSDCLCNSMPRSVQNRVSESQPGALCQTYSQNMSYINSSPSTSSQGAQAFNFHFTEIRNEKGASVVRPVQRIPQRVPNPPPPPPTRMEDLRPGASSSAFCIAAVLTQQLGACSSPGRHCCAPKWWRRGLAFLVPSCKRGRAAFWAAHADGSAKPRRQ